MNKHDYASFSLNLLLWHLTKPLNQTLLYMARFLYHTALAEAHTKIMELCVHARKQLLRNSYSSLNSIQDKKCQSDKTQRKTSD